MANRDIQPIFILPENTSRTTGKDAQRMNIMAAKLVAETVRTTLGPKGMDKMIVDGAGDVIVTNDGVTILEEMNIEHPSAKMIVEIAKTQEDEVGDGTTTAVVLAGEFLKKAEFLLDQEIHPTVIAKGYRMAAEKAKEILNEIAEDVKDTDDDVLKNIAITAMTGKGAESSKDLLADLVVKGVKRIINKDKNGNVMDKNDIKIEKKVGAGVDESILIDGIVLDKERVHSGMPKKVENAKIALIDSAVEVKNTEIEAKISITDPEKMQAFLDMEENMLRKMVDRVISSGANVLFCQKGVDDMAQHFLAKKGVFTCRRISKSDLEKLAKATGANIVTDLNELSAKDLGKAGVVEEVKVGDESMTYVMNCKNPKAVTLLVRGSTEHVVDEVKRAVEDAIGDIIASLKNHKAVGGAGAPEMELSKQLLKYSESLSGREQLAVKAFAEAMEIIPRTLAENAGLDPIDVLTELRAAHDKNQKWAGINVFTGKVVDAWKLGVIEPLKIKTQAVSSAAEVAVMILRIDDVISGASGGGGNCMPQGMPPGMGGMPDY
ncbi:MAG: TCP-1/cpn60 chaperonin family protein [Nanoarchaeota archaeon]|nr:TCP-1/cpn60 chaperonin family protein [Nanoarchaeota archaeon]MBU1321865.1 TCP-1/cpn60 chaperonin family protein [Nanoarchaeota archaeon]MBU2441909.1 TCP-1/cpn60 chaperonin family protein [Nanoarchaeota archaeon]